MTKFIKILFLICATTMFTSPVSAKIMHLWELRNFLYFGSTNLGGGIKDGSVYTCNQGDGTYKTKPSGMTCEQQEFAGGTKCYTNCYCAKSDFPYTAQSCSGSYFKAPTGGDSKCTDSSGTFYKTCGCVDGLSSTVSSSISTYFNVTNAKYSLTDRNGSVLNCYNPSLFTCKSSYRQIPKSEVSDGTQLSDIMATVLSANEPVSYNVATNMPYAANYNNANLIMCVTGVQGLGDGVFASAPNTNKCAQFTSKTATYYPSKTYYYYTGTCSTSGECDSTPQDCLRYSNETFTTFNPGTNSTGTVTCKYISGCSIGWSSDGYFCNTLGSTNEVPVGITKSVIHSEDGSYEDCVKVSGCQSGYETFKFTESTDISEVTTQYAKATESETILYNAVKYQTSPNADDRYSYIICRQATGCKTSTSTGAPVCDADTTWGGYFAWFVQ